MSCRRFVFLAASLFSASSLTAQAAPPRTDDPRITERRISFAGGTISLRSTNDGFIDATLTAPAAALYAVVAAAYADVGLTPKEVDSGRQTVSTGTVRAQYRIGKARMSTYLDCGLDPVGLRQADSFAISLRITTQVVPESADRATVRTLVQASGRPASNSGVENHCSTTGKLEERIAEAIAKKAQP